MLDVDVPPSIDVPESPEQHASEAPASVAPVGNGGVDDQGVPNLLKPASPSINLATSVPAEDAQTSAIPPLLRAPPSQPINLASSIPADQAAQQAAQQQLEQFQSGKQMMPFDQFKANNTLAEGNTSAVGRTAKGAASVMGGIMDFGRSLGNTDTYANGYHWLHGLFSEVTKPYDDARNAILQGDPSKAVEDWAKGEWDNVKSVGVSALGGTEKLLPQAIGLGQGCRECHGRNDGA